MHYFFNYETEKYIFEKQIVIVRLVSPIRLNIVQKVLKNEINFQYDSKIVKLYLLRVENVCV